AFLSELKDKDLASLGIDSIADLIKYLKENATTANGFTVDDVISLLTTLLTTSTTGLKDVLLEMEGYALDGDLKVFLSNLMDGDFGALGITDLATLIDYLMESATTANGFTTDDVRLMMAMYGLDTTMDAGTALDKLLAMVSDTELAAFLSKIKSEGLSSLGIDSLSELIQYLKENATDANGYTIDDLVALLTALKMSGTTELESILSEMESIATDEELKSFLSELLSQDLESLGISDIADLIKYLKSKAGEKGYTEEDVETLLLLLCADGESLSSLYDKLLSVLLGGDETLAGLVNALLSVGLEDLETVEDLLNALIITAGGKAVTELKTLLSKVSNVSSYTSATSLLNAILTEVTDTDKAANANGITLVNNLLDALATQAVDDATLLSALKTLYNGGGAGELAKVLLSAGAGEALMKSLLAVDAGGDVNLLNLLMNVNMNGVTTAQELFEKLVLVDSDEDEVCDVLEILLGTDPQDGSVEPESFSYRYEVKADAKLKSQTFYEIDFLNNIPQSIADYTLTYYRNGADIRDTTVYYYQDPSDPDGEDDVRASVTTPAWRKTRSVTYSGDARSAILDYDKDGLPNYLESYTNDADGDGLMDFEDMYSHSADSTKTDADWYIDTNGTIPTYTDTATGTSGNVANDGIRDDAIRKSETYYMFDNISDQGEEIMDYTYVYDSLGDEVKETTVYYYEDDMLRAQGALGEGREESRKKLVRTYLYDVIARGEYSTTRQLLNGQDGIINENAFRKAETYYYFDKINTIAGDEITDFTLNYVAGTETVRETVVYNYEKHDGTNDSLRAEEVTKETEVMSKSLTYIGSYLVDVTDPETNKVSYVVNSSYKYPARSITYYYAPEDSVRGDEVM
ncbi:MAG TPA: hypothetical protein PKG81_01185, partial [Candidatus Omnitrophota bacterium]|nr:hypothetical protein [Candidatus Omnitrophota bacterium]